MYPGLRYAHKKLKLSGKKKVTKEYKIRFAVEKKFFGLISKLFYCKFLCRHQKNASYTIFIYENCMLSIFSKSKTSVLSSQNCFIGIKQPQNLVYIFYQPFFENVGKLFDKHFSIHLMYGIV